MPYVLCTSLQSTEIPHTTTYLKVTYTISDHRCGYVHKVTSTTPIIANYLYHQVVHNYIPFYPSGAPDKPSGAAPPKKGLARTLPITKVAKARVR